MTGDPPYYWDAFMYGYLTNVLHPSPPRCIMVNVPLPEDDPYETIVIVDKEGNISIKVNQLKQST